VSVLWTGKEDDSAIWPRVIVCPDCFRGVTRKRLGCAVVYFCDCKQGDLDHGESDRP
jgi:hypothetical protein